MIIVDTTVWVDYFHGKGNRETLWLDEQIGVNQIALTDLIVSEVLQGVPSESQSFAIQKQLLEFEVFSNGGLQIAIAAAQNFRILRARGFTVRKTIDCWIATFCIRESHTLLHRDRDFEPFEEFLGLQVVKA
jgi:predicted nucleic acid-binding protein